MENIQIDTLPVKTFSWLGVNETVRENAAPVRERTEISGESGNTVRTDIRESGLYAINAESGKNFTVIQFIEPADKIRIRTDARLAEYSSLKLVQIFSGKSSVVSELGSVISENAQLELIQIYLGGDDSVSIKAGLNGRKSQFSADIGYLLQNSESLDIDLVAEHSGRRSVSHIAADGVMKDASRKIFRGTIDFRRGASGAKGAEQESVLLLSGKAENRTLPVILCEEEDVEGSHGATIGRIDEKQIFYMRSRGIPEEKIYEITARARLEKVIRKIGDEQTERRIYDILNWCEEDG